DDEACRRLRRSVKLPSVKFRDFTLMTRLLRGGSSRGRPVFRWLSLLLLRPLRPPSLALNREHLAVCLELRLQDRLREQQRPPHARARAHIHKLVLIWRKQVLTRDERGREHPLTLGVGPHINEPLLLGVVEQRLLARELPWQHRPSAALLEPSLPRHWAVLRTYPLRPLNALRLTLPPRPISCRERSICHEHARPQQQARQDKVTAAAPEGPSKIRRPLKRGN